jgi:ComF family protein
MSISAWLDPTICSLIEHFWLPGACLLCGAGSREALCGPCLAELPEQVPAEGWLGQVNGLLARALWHYSEPADRVVLAFKYGGQASLARLWAARIAPRLPLVDALVAMPMHRERLAERGENLTEVMAHALRRQLPGRPPLIIATRTRLTARQKGLDRAGRLANVAGSVRIDSDLRDRRVLLVDDVLTTGASLLTLAAAARAAGAVEVTAVAMAQASD